MKKIDEKKKKWYAIYTKPRAEKKVLEQLEKLGYTAYLPLKKEVRQWKDRLKKVEVPLFSSYIFVKVNDKEYIEIPKQVKGFVKYVNIGKQRTEVREEEIDAIKKMIKFSQDTIESSSENFELLEKVEIKSGKLKGLSGRLVEFRGKYRIAVRIESIGTNLLVEINKNSVKKAE